MPEGLQNTTKVRPRAFTSVHGINSFIPPRHSKHHRKYHQSRRTPERKEHQVSPSRKTLSGQKLMTGSPHTSFLCWYKPKHRSDKANYMPPKNPDFPTTKGSGNYNIVFYLGTRLHIIHNFHLFATISSIKFPVLRAVTKGHGFSGSGLEKKEPR